MVYVRRSNKNTTGYFYCYGAEILVDYTAENVHVTSVSVSPSSATIEQGETVELTETVLPSNATDKSVTWSSSNTSVATVSNGTVTGVSPGTATITVTTVDGNKTATCSITVTAAILVEYVQTDTLVPGKDYLIVNGNTGSVYVLSNEAGGSRILKGVSAIINNGKLSIRQSIEENVKFSCSLYTSGNDITTSLMNSSLFLYSDSSNGLRLYTKSPMDRFWHYKDGKLWLFKSSTTNGYTDTSSEYKYYLSCDSSGNFTDNHLTSPSVQDTEIPNMYLFIKYEGVSLPIRVKQNGQWVTASKLFVKQNGSWTQSTTIKVKNNGTWK